MASIRKRIKTNSETVYDCSIVIKKHGQIVHRESKTFLKQKLAKDWGMRREVELQEQDVSEELQRTGCTRHIYIPSLIPFKQINANAEKNWIEYEKEDGKRFKNGDDYFSSEEIRTGNHSALGGEGVEALKKHSGPDWLVPAEAPDLVTHQAPFKDGLPHYESPAKIAETLSQNQMATNGPLENV